jgi:hypothetical protein
MPPTVATPTPGAPEARETRQGPETMLDIGPPPPPSDGARTEPAHLFACFQCRAPSKSAVAHLCGALFCEEHWLQSPTLRIRALCPSCGEPARPEDGVPAHFVRRQIELMLPSEFSNACRPRKPRRRVSAGADVYGTQFARVPALLVRQNYWMCLAARDGHEDAQFELSLCCEAAGETDLAMWLLEEAATREEPRAVAKLKALAALDALSRLKVQFGPGPRARTRATGVGSGSGSGSGSGVGIGPTDSMWPRPRRAGPVPRAGPRPEHASPRATPFRVLLSSSSSRQDPSPPLPSSSPSSPSSSSPSPRLSSSAPLPRPTSGTPSGTPLGTPPGPSSSLSFAALPAFLSLGAGPERQSPPRSPQQPPPLPEEPYGPPEPAPPPLATSAGTEAALTGVGKSDRAPWVLDLARVFGAFARV